MIFSLHMNNRYITYILCIKLYCTVDWKYVCYINLVWRNLVSTLYV